MISPSWSIANRNPGETPRGTSLDSNWLTGWEWYRWTEYLSELQPMDQFHHGPCPNLNHWSASHGEQLGVHPPGKGLPSHQPPTCVEFVSSWAKRPWWRLKYETRDRSFQREILPAQWRWIISCEAMNQRPAAASQGLDHTNSWVACMKRLTTMTLW